MVDKNKDQYEKFADGESMHKSGYGHNLFQKVWKKEGQNARCLVFICHGYGEHCLAYNEMALQLLDKECIVFALDHVGHGQSEGSPVDVSSFSVYVDDVTQMVTDFKSKHANLPCFVIGHSMGGAISILAASRTQNLFKGVILIAPAIVVDKQTATPFMLFFANAASYVMPQLQVGRIKPHLLSRDPKVGQNYEKDPLTWHGGFKSRQAMCFLNAMSEIQQLIPSIDFPFFILHGTDDKLCHLDGSKLMLEKSKSKDKTLKIYEGAYHQIHLETEGVAEDCLQLILEWIASHL